MAFDKSKMPPGLLKEVPSSKGNSKKQEAIKRRLAKTDEKSDNKRIRIG